MNYTFGMVHKPNKTGPHGRGLGPGKGKADGTGLKETAEDDTLMGRLGKRMASRDFIDRQQLGNPTKPPGEEVAELSVPSKLRLSNQIKRIDK